MEKLMEVSEITVGYKPIFGARPVVKSNLEAYKVIKAFFPDDTIGLYEQMVVIYLNRANRVLAAYRLSTGGITGTVADLRLLLSVGLKILATNFMMAHNHPSGNKIPSQQDIDLTKKISEAGKLLDITLLDHLILVPSVSEYYSFAESGFI
jgi:DNA repair protein RadC